jgi:hypothetical protein
MYLYCHERTVQMSMTNKLHVFKDCFRRYTVEQRQEIGVTII